jgi:CHAD domain-containing protein
MAEKPAVSPDVAVGEALRAVLRDILSEARAALADQTHSDAVAVHDYRKAMKRWRALLRLLEPLLGDDCRRLRIEARDAARELAGARDAQAAIEALDDLAEHDSGLSARTVASIRARLDGLRKNAEAAILTQALRARLIVALETAEAAIGAWPLDRITFPEFAHELAEAYRRMREDTPAEWRTAEPHVLHELRGRVVAHRYQMELIEPLWPRLGRVWVAEAQRLRDQLGAHHDLAVMLGLAAPHQPLAPWRSRLTPLVLERQKAHAKAAGRIAGRLLAEKPRAFRRRIEALWDSGQR